eukprot:PhM_4_TR17803/c0_g1_i1/m.19034
MGCGGSKQQQQQQTQGNTKTTQQQQQQEKQQSTAAASSSATEQKYTPSAAHREEDDEELPIVQEEEIKQTKAMEKLAAVVVEYQEVPNIEEELFVWGDFKVDIQEAVKQRAERLVRVRRPQVKNEKLGDEEEIFMWGDFAVATHAAEETVVPVLSEEGIKNFSTYSLIGHASRVKCIALAPGEKQFVSCSNEDTSVTMQDLLHGKEIQAFLGHEDTIISAAFSADHKYLATTSRDNTMILWDVVTAKQILTFEHEKVVICCAFSRDSKLLVSGCQDKICRVWDTRKGRELLSFTQHEGIIIAVAFSPIEDMICSASADKTLRLWSSSTGEMKRVLQGHTGIVLTCWFNRTGDRVVSNDEKTVRVWSADTGECVFTASVESYIKKPFMAGVKKLTWTLCAYCPGRFAKYVVVASNTRVVMVINPDTGEEVMSLHCKAPVYCLSSGGDSTMVCGDSFGNIYVIKLK